MIPLHTTTITVLRPPANVDPYDGAPARPVATNVRAVIGSPSGADTRLGGDVSSVSARLDCDPCDVKFYDQVRDDQTRDVYEIVWLRNRSGFGLDHVEAGLAQVQGAANA